VKALVWAAVLNGIVAVPVMALLMLLSTSTAIMGAFRVAGRWTVIGWVATAMMGLASAAFVLAMV
jgi:Mn2+/Fe2+ NRAMP family transporter